MNTVKFKNMDDALKFNFTRSEYTNILNVNFENPNNDVPRFDRDLHLMDSNEDKEFCEELLFDVVDAVKTNPNIESYWVHKDNLTHRFAECKLLDDSQLIYDFLGDPEFIFLSSLSSFDGPAGEFYDYVAIAWYKDQMFHTKFMHHTINYEKLKKICVESCDGYW